MPKKLGRRTAGERVAALAQAFADDLLEDEERAFTRCAAVFSRGIGEMRRTTALGDEAWLSKVVTTHLAAAASTVDIAEQLATTAISKALASMGEELAVCEATLSPKYAGVAELAVQGAQEATSKTVRQATSAYQRDADTAATEFEARARLQLGQSADAGEASTRLFSPVSAGLRGFGGRGVWWWTVTDLNEALRSVSIRSANLARLSAMQTFNRLAEDR